MTTDEVKEAKIERAEGQKLGMALRNLDGKLCVTKISDGGAVKVRLKSSFLLDLMIYSHTSYTHLKQSFK